MTHRIKIRINNWGIGPTWYHNFCKHISNHDDRFYKTVRFEEYEYIFNTYLKKELCSIKLITAQNNEKNKESLYWDDAWYLEFDTNEDYIAFMLKWA